MVYAGLAQLVERLVYTEYVGGSSPSSRTTRFFVVEVVDDFLGAMFSPALQAFTMAAGVAHPSLDQRA